VVAVTPRSTENVFQREAMHAQLVLKALNSMLSASQETHSINGYAGLQVRENDIWWKQPITVVIAGSHLLECKYLIYELPSAG